MSRLLARIRRLLNRCECCGERADFTARDFGRAWCSECKFAVHPTCWCSRHPYIPGGIRP